ncbi:hypothetical protein Tco_0485043, partial [Tanacetum coccineum]
AQEAKDIYKVIDREYSSIQIPARCDIENPDDLCRTEEFIVVRHSIGDDEEFVTVGPSKINTVKRTHGSMSCIYHELLNRKDRGWEVKNGQPQYHYGGIHRLEEEKALSRGETFNWQTATYGKMEYCEDEDDYVTNFEFEFPAIVLDDTPREALSWEPTVSPLNDNENDFRISFDESDDEDYTVVYAENSFSYKIISVNNLKTDSENDNDKVNMPSFPSPELEVNYFNNLDFFKDFENEFPAIVYNDALTSKSDFLTEHIVSPQHIDEFNNETSLSECDEKEQNILYFNDLFPFNVIYPDDLKSDTGNDNDKFNIEQPLGDMSVIPLPNVINVDTQGSNKLLETSHDTYNKFFKTETFIKNLNVNIMTCNHLSNGMSFIFLIKNLYVPFGILFDPKLFYKDGIKLGEKVKLKDKLKQKCFSVDNPVILIVCRI